MSGRQINLFLWTTAVALVVGAVALAIAGVWVPVSVDSAQATAARRAAATQGSAGKGRSADGLEAVVSARWRRPLTDAPVPVAAAAVAQAPATSEQLPMTLVGTVGTSLAMLQSSDGNVELKGVGESSGGMKVLAVRPSQVDVEYNGRKLTLNRPKETEGSQ
jgi:type II secretory pathway pseudopilin PulG